MGAHRRAAVLALVACTTLLLARLAACQQAVVGQHPVEMHHHKKHQHHEGHRAEEELECADVKKLGPEADRCAFVRDKCAERSSLIHYPQLYYCNVAPHGRLLAALMLAVCVILLGLLFRVISRASEDFFSCILSQISQDLGLPPRLGGVTLLALGNGAPDLSASIEAVKSGDYQLAMGALTGAGMFVGAVVAGRIVTLSGGVRARGAQIRDMSTQFITVAVVTGIVASGAFTYGSVALLLSIYAAYVVVVAVADFSKRMGVEWGDVARNVSRRVSQRWHRVEMTAPLLREDYGDGSAAAAGAAPAAPMHSTSPGSRGLVRQQGGLGVASGPRLLPTPEEEQLSDLPPAGTAGTAGGTAAGDGMRRPPVSGGALGLAAAGSLPVDLEAAGGESGWLPRVRRDGRAASLPDLRLEAAHRQQYQQQQQYPGQHEHARHGPPVAHFQPHMSYSDIVQMSAKDYRQRALAEMAQSKSFFARGIGRVEEDGSDSDSDELCSGGEEDGFGYEAPEWAEQGAASTAGTARSHSPTHGRARWSGGSGAGANSGGSNGVHPPVAALDATLLAAREAVAEFEAEQAAAAAAAGGGGEAGSGGASATPPGPLHSPLSRSQPVLQQVRQQSGSGSRGSGASGASTLQFSVASLEVAPPAAPSPAPLVEAPQGGQGRLFQAAEAVQRPVLLLLQSTIPLVEANSYQRPWFLRSLAASPLFIAAYLHLFAWQALLVAACTGAALAALGHLGTRRLQGKAPLWTLGTGYPIGAALVAVYGFGVAAMWISLFASEIVGLLQFFGMLSKVEPAVLGVTVLAWGNSLMDYLNNTAMAGRSRGGHSMAMTACFAGPLFNMLVGLGLGFWALFQDTHATRAAVTMDPVVLVGCVFIMLNTGFLVGVSLTHRHWLPAWCGWAMVATYCAYLASVLVVLLLGG